MLETEGPGLQSWTRWPRGVGRGLYVTLERKLRMDVPVSLWRFCFVFLLLFGFSPCAPSLCLSFFVALSVCLMAVLLVLLPFPPKCWDSRSFVVVLGLHPKLCVCELITLPASSHPDPMAQWILAYTWRVLVTRCSIRLPSWLRLRSRTLRCPRKLGTRVHITHLQSH